MLNLSEMTNTELKQYISRNRNNIEAFQAAMEILMSRRNPANRHPYPFDLENPEAEVTNIFREKLDKTKSQ
jgi:hypothetical protein